MFVLLGAAHQNPAIVGPGLGNLIVLLDRLGYSLAAATVLGHLATKIMDFALFAPELAAAAAHLQYMLDPFAFECG